VSDYFTGKKMLRAVLKISPHSGGFVQWRHLADKGGGYSNADVHTFWCKKLWIFRKL